MMGYAVERAGVVIDMGGHQMLVADACSGMNSIVSLAALTLLYTHLTGPSSTKRWIVLLASVIPIAIAANVLRVLALALIAYHFGDDVAQGMVHTAAGLLLFIVAFLLLTGLDSLFGLRGSPSGGNAGARDSHRLPPTAHRKAAFVVAALMITTALAAPLLEPVRAEGPSLQPVHGAAAFGDWSIDPETFRAAHRRRAGKARSHLQPDRLAHVRERGGRAHDAHRGVRRRPERCAEGVLPGGCHTAQGFTIHDLHADQLAVKGGRSGDAHARHSR